MRALATGLYGQGLLYGGPVVLIWGWVLTGLFTMMVGLAMSELSSKFPVSGGLLVIHAGWRVRALCKLACGLGEFAGAGELPVGCCVASCNQIPAELSLCRLPLSVGILTHLCSFLLLDYFFVVAPLP